MKLDKGYIHNSFHFYGLLISILAMPFSILICHLGIILVILNWVIKGEWLQKWERLQQNPLALIFTMFFCLMLAGTFYSSDAGNAWFSVEKKFIFSIIPITLATTTLSEKNKDQLLKAFVLCCATATIICLGTATFQTVSNTSASILNFGIIQPASLLANPFFTNQWQFFSYVALSSGIGIHPTYFSVYLIFCIAILISKYRSGTFNKTISIVLITYFSLFLALLSTRITLVVVLAVVLLGISYLITNIPKVSAQSIAVGSTLILLFIVLSALNPVSLYREFQEINSTNFQIQENTRYSNSTEVRLSLWWAGMKTALKTDPIIGAGTGDTPQEMRETLSIHNISNALDTSDPHNQFLYTFISLGSIGLLLLLACYILPLRGAWLEKDVLHLSFIGLVLLVSFTESFLESQKGIVFFVLFQSLLAFGKPSSSVRSNIVLS